jgi:CheY-like chemotaxis protein
MMKPARILLVEDDPDSAEAIRLLLGLEGYVVLPASTGAEAVAIFEASRSDDERAEMLLLDLMLPDMDCQVLLDRLAAIAPLPPVVFHSAAPERVLMEAASRVGAVAVLRKPSDWSEISEAVRTTLANEPVRVA